MLITLQAVALDSKDRNNYVDNIQPSIYFYTLVLTEKWREVGVPVVWNLSPPAVTGWETSTNFRHKLKYNDILLSVINPTVMFQSVGGSLNTQKEHMHTQ